MRVALTTIHASTLVLVLGCQCAQAAAPEQREREPQRANPPAAAPAQGQGRSEQRSERMLPPAPVQAQRNDSRQFEPRQPDGRAEELRRQEPGTHQNSDAFRRNGRLTPDERRDLRRQINEAGQDIYRNTPRR